MRKLIFQHLSKIELLNYVVKKESPNTLYTLSLAIGRSQGYIQSISSGRILPSMNTFLDICKYFDITPTEFFDPSFQNPTLLHSIISDISKFSEEDLLLLSSVLKRITRN